LHAVGWDVEELGLSGSPPIRVLVGARRHVSVDRALRFLGIGRASLRVVPADGAGRIQVRRLREELAAGGGPAIICATASNSGEKANRIRATSSGVSLHSITDHTF